MEENGKQTYVEQSTHTEHIANFRFNKKWCKWEKFSRENNSIVKLTAIKSMQIHFCHLNWPFSYYFIEKRFIYSPLNIILSVFFHWDLLLSQRWGKIGENIYRAVKSNIFKSFWYCICISSILLTNDMYDSYDS